MGLDKPKREAWVTLVTSEEYSQGALVLCQSLHDVGTTRETVVMVTADVPEATRVQLASVFDHVVSIEALNSDDYEILQLMGRPELGVTLSKIQAWRLVDFTKALFVDADCLMLQNCDELFDHEELSAVADCGWPDCFNSGVFVFQPSLATYKALRHLAQTEGSFDGGDQGLLNAYWSEWHTADRANHLSIVYNMHTNPTYTYLPAFKHYGHAAKIVHFIGSDKPWNYADQSKWATSGLFADYIQHWWQTHERVQQITANKETPASSNQRPRPLAIVKVAPEDAERHDSLPNQTQTTATPTPSMDRPWVVSQSSEGEPAVSGGRQHDTATAEDVIQLEADLADLLQRGFLFEEGVLSEPTDTTEDAQVEGCDPSRGLTPRQLLHRLPPHLEKLRASQPMGSHILDNFWKGESSSTQHTVTNADQEETSLVDQEGWVDDHYKRYNTVLAEKTFCDSVHPDEEATGESGVNAVSLSKHTTSPMPLPILAPFKGVPYPAPPKSPSLHSSKNIGANDTEKEAEGHDSLDGQCQDQCHMECHEECCTSTSVYSTAGRAKQPQWDFRMVLERLERIIPLTPELSNPASPNLEEAEQRPSGSDHWMLLSSDTVAVPDSWVMRTAQLVRDIDTNLWRISRTLSQKRPTSQQLEQLNKLREHVEAAHDYMDALSMTTEESAVTELDGEGGIAAKLVAQGAA